MVSPRIQPLNKQKVVKGKYVLLLMRCIRVHSSPSFSFASQRANASSVPLLATYTYVPGLGNLKKQFLAMESSILISKAANDVEAMQRAVKLSENACEVVIDAPYLREDRENTEYLNDLLINLQRRLTSVEGNVIVPVTMLSTEVVYNTPAIRKKVWHYINDMLAEDWTDTPIKKCRDWKKLIQCNVTELDISSELNGVRSEGNFTKIQFKGGEDEGNKVLDHFLRNKMGTYDKNRNVPNGENQSGLSPYIHFGMLNPLEIVRKVQKANVADSSKKAFLEELAVRRELSHNFVYFCRENYDSLECLPSWAKQTLSVHLDDERAFTYSAEELENGHTHDPYWNAAQFELVYTHKMHGYMRMYWAKKVIEWSSDYQSAYAFLIEQNDKYSLDGRDPNGYCGVIWNFGKFDRAHAVTFVHAYVTYELMVVSPSVHLTVFTWSGASSKAKFMRAERPVLGKLRYMNAEGLRRKFKKSLEDYVEVNYKRAGRELPPAENEPPKKKMRVGRPKTTS